MLEYLAQHNLQGLALGLCTFLIIGLFHPLVIKGEYYMGIRCWWMFLLLGLASGAASAMCAHIFTQSLLAVVAFSSLWSILEVFQQRRRVEKGWFPSNPRRRKRNLQSQ